MSFFLLSLCGSSAIIGQVLCLLRQAQTRGEVSDTSDWHIPLADVTLISDAEDEQLNADVRDALKRSYGEQVYFRLLLSGMKLGEEPKRIILGLLQRPTGAE
jgi:hypothetical protein